MRQILTYIALAFAVLVVGPGQAVAASCSKAPMLASAFLSEAVFVGTVTDVKFFQPPTKNGRHCGPKDTAFVVEKGWKGVSVGDEITVYSADQCNWVGQTFAIGKKYLVYAYELNRAQQNAAFPIPEGSKAKLVSTACDNTRPLSDSSISTIYLDILFWYLPVALGLLILFVLLRRRKKEGSLD